MQPVSEITFLRKLDLPEGSVAHRGYLLKRTRLMLGGDYLTSGKERSKKKRKDVENVKMLSKRSLQLHLMEA